MLFAVCAGPWRTDAYGAAGVAQARDECGYFVDRHTRHGERDDQRTQYDRHCMIRHASRPLGKERARLFFGVRERCSVNISA